MNMKPPEILSLLEEASGTKLYERKKDNAMKTLAKKQTRLEEIDEVSRLVRGMGWPLMGKGEGLTEPVLSGGHVAVNGLAACMNATAACHVGQCPV